MSRRVGGLHLKLHIPVLSVRLFTAEKDGEARQPVRVAENMNRSKDEQTANSGKNHPRLYTLLRAEPCREKRPRQNQHEMSIDAHRPKIRPAMRTVTGRRKADRPDRKNEPRKHPPRCKLKPLPPRNQCRADAGGNADHIPQKLFLEKEDATIAPENAVNGTFPCEHKPHRRQQPGNPNKRPFDYLPVFHYHLLICDSF